MEETDLPIIEDLPSNNTSYIYPDEVDANNEGNSAVDEQSSNTNVNAPIFNFLPIVVNVPDQTSSIHGNTIEKFQHANEKHQSRAQRFQVPFVKPLISNVLNQTDMAKQKYSNPTGTFVTGFDITSAEEQQRIATRKERFGLDTRQLNQDPELQEQVERLKRKHRFGEAQAHLGEFSEGGNSSAMDIDPQLQARNPSAECTVRMDAVHMYGTDQMSTKDVLQYFSDYGPAFVEWINDSSCNVVWEDNYSAFRSLLGLSVSEEAAVSGVDPLQQQTKEAYLSWRIGRSAPKSSSIRLRFATSEDVKKFNAAEQSTYYKLYGRPGFGNIRSNTEKKPSKNNTGSSVQQLQQQSKQNLNQNRKNSRERKMNQLRSQNNAMDVSTSSDDNMNSDSNADNGNRSHRNNSKKSQRQSRNNRSSSSSSGIVDAIAIQERRQRAENFKNKISNALENN